MAEPTLDRGLRKMRLERERLAKNLQVNLQTFAGADFERRHELLPDLLGQIRTCGNRDHLEMLPNIQDFDPQLGEAIAKTLQTPWEIGDDNLVYPWTGGYTVVALRNDGTVISLASKKTTTPGYEGLGDLTPYALAKATCALHLSKAVGAGHDSFAGGLSTLRNIEYLKQRGNKTHDGATENPAHVENQFIFFGASGCTATPEYLDALLDEGAKSGPFTLAGALDKFFVETTKRHLVQPDLGTNPLPEPRFCRTMRAAWN
ncbi:hypothetical protein KKC08_02760 [Patescibacteria group bacterium]|nr:hypothetical protein [Patescibacteria group bacterium]MCG2701580.1 hypothetical protein [Candidatus Parcubacteria bacterium]MBU4264452.1 hypothetical protein [Patescibacteria group bacterium]MBU4390383.1 hypothetical protein [Patescibacteria group bacterium]MBU4397059.1 hypothetical protein [Patescibacteria group bacterium]